MDNNKIPTSVGTIVLLIIAVTTCGFIWKYEKNKPIESDLETSFQMKKNDNSTNENRFKISDKWTLVSHDNFWNNPTLFSSSNYKFPKIEFYYPENWEFRCCNDMDYASTHTIYSSKDRDKSLPFIRITNVALSGCPDLKDVCSIDKVIVVTANKKFNQLTSSIPAADILPKIKLEKLNTSAFVYKKIEKDNKISKGYLINLNDAIVEIDFVNYELLDDVFINDFLNRISLEVK